MWCISTLRIIPAATDPADGEGNKLCLDCAYFHTYKANEAAVTLLTSLTSPHQGDTNTTETTGAGRLTPLTGKSMWSLWTHNLHSLLGKFLRMFLIDIYRVHHSPLVVVQLNLYLLGNALSVHDTESCIFDTFYELYVVFSHRYAFHPCISCIEPRPYADSSENVCHLVT